MHFAFCILRNRLTLQWFFPCWESLYPKCGKVYVYTFTVKHFFVVVVVHVWFVWYDTRHPHHFMISCRVRGKFASARTHFHSPLCPSPVMGGRLLHARSTRSFHMFFYHTTSVPLWLRIWASAGISNAFSFHHHHQTQTNQVNDE